MSFGSWLFFGTLFIGALLLATAWAKYGLLELGIQRPTTPLFACGMSLGMIAMGGAVIAYFATGFNPKIGLMSYIVGLGPILWVPIFRCLFMPPGLADYNRAIIRTRNWALTSYRPGQILEDPAKNLRDFPMAQSAVEMFRRAIAAQSKGTKLRMVERQINTDGLEEAYDGCARISCPGCGWFPLLVPLYARTGATGCCNMCGSMISVRRIGDVLHISAMLHKPVWKVTDQNRHGMAVAHEELAWLLRMMNRFEEAEAELGLAQEQAAGLLADYPDRQEYQALKSLILFRRGEIAHTQGNGRQARELYEQSLAVDRELGDEGGAKATTQLLSEL
ncbi:MAG: tetratricopeptide repeat protein [bacterium]|nr:tetratricopeptide repeat protein [bacterium]